MRMWAGSLTRITPSFVQVMVAVAEFAVQNNQITDCSTMLWSHPLFWKRMSGRGLTVNRAKDGEGKEWGGEGGEVKEGKGNI